MWKRRNKPPVFFFFVLIFTVQSIWTGSCIAADTPNYVVFGLYADELHTTNCIYVDSLCVFPIYFCIYIAPCGNGVIALEMSVEKSSGNLLTFAQVYNADVVELAMGSVPGEVTMLLNDCYDDGWIRIFSIQAILLHSSTEYLEIGPYGDRQYPKILDCTSIYDWDVLEYYSAYVNDPECLVPIGTRESTWGAIKKMYE
jgi:hypothetical protein